MPNGGVARRNTATAVAEGMIRRLPIFATLMVLAACATMVGLGFWQLGRKQKKEALLVSYAAAADNPDPVRQDFAAPSSLYRRAAGVCIHPAGFASVAGTSERGQAGWALLATCAGAGAKPLQIELGWSRNPQPVAWAGGTFTGIVAPPNRNGARIVAEPPLGGLEALARPDPADVPNNHLSYAVQWFLFAITALIIYVLALRNRLAGDGGRG